MNEEELQEELTQEQQPQSFEDAQNAAEQIFENNTNAEANENDINNMLADRLEENQEALAQQSENANQAAQTAQAAVNTAQEQDDRIMQLMDENNQLRQSITQMQQQFSEQIGQIQQREQQMSDLQKQSVMESALEMPELNMSELAFADEETAKRLQSEYSENMSKYIRAQMMSELEPYLQEAKQARSAKERANIIDMLSRDEVFSGIDEQREQIFELIDRNSSKFAPDMSEEEKVAMAYIMSKGVAALNAPPPQQPSPPTVDELMNLYESNPEFQAAIEQKRIDSIKNSQSVPVMSASQGAANAALHIKERPKNFDEAREAVSKLFGNR